MIRKDRKTFADGSKKTQIRVVEGYRPAPGATTKQRTIRSFGYLEDQDDPVAFMAMVEEFNETYKKEKPPLHIEVPANALMYSKQNQRLNYGWKFLDAVYSLLEIDTFIDCYEQKHRFRGEYSPSEIFKFLVLMRIISPDSKRASFQLKDNFYGMNTSFTLQNVYRALDNFADFNVQLQRHLNEKIKQTIGRDLSHAFYDVTNYFFEIDFPNGEDDLRKRGVSKEHRVDPITAMGLFMDSNGLPVTMSIFPGNTSDSVTLQPTMSDVKESYGLDRLVVVADKGMNSSKNMNTIINNGDGFVFSQILKGKKGKRYHEKLFDGDEWIANTDNTYRYKLFEEEYTLKNSNGTEEIHKRKVLLYWSKTDADIARRKREEKLQKAERSVKNNAYSIAKGASEYMQEHILDRQTGECLEDIKKIRSVNIQKAEKDSMYDGYFCIITSELDYDERKMRQVYGGLWRIEQSFRIMKSDLYARPVFVSKNEHIIAHFLICFVSLLIVRIIQHKMGKNALSAERIARVLRTATCHVLKGGIIHLDDVGGAIAFKKTIDKVGNRVDTLEYSDEDEIALDYHLIQNTFGTDFYNIYPKQEVFNKFLKDIKL